MNCASHPDRAAAGACMECGKYVCTECKVVIEGKVYCNSCVERWILPGTVVAAPASPQLQTQYTPGAVNNPILPPGLGDFNWGAFLLTWIWGIGNGVYWSFLVFVPYLGALVMPWVLAFKGNEWAWRTGRWDSVEHFQRVQKTWTRAGFIVLVVSSFILATVLVAGLMMIAWGLSQAGIKGL